MPDPVANASITLVLTRNGDSWTFGGETDGGGQVTFALRFAQAGDYKAEVTGLTHSTLTWNSVMDADNPDFYYGVPNGSE